MRVSKNQYYLNIAHEVSKRSTCLRRAYGAVIVKNDEIIATGYNGSSRGQLNCSDAGHCRRETMKIPAGERYELCNGIHAEMNACLQAGRKNTIGAVLYLSGTDLVTGERIKDPTPCVECARIINQCGIERVFWGGS